MGIEEERTIHKSVKIEREMDRIKDEPVYEER